MKKRGDEPHPTRHYTKSMDKEIAKRLHRYQCFVRRFETDIQPKFMRDLIKGMIKDHEKHDAFKIHHIINNGGCVWIYEHFKTKNNL